MCGIVGIYNFGNGRSVAEDILRQMCSVIRHRGPDDEGLYLKQNAGLGMRRLAIIDLKTGNQPMRNEDGTVWVVCNGEIYNFQELRAEMESKGHKFYTDSDIEVILHLYEEYGTQCLQFLNGMFAFAVWDERRKQLFIARDRIGQKPLVWAEKDGSFYFASEMKSLFCIPEVEREIDHEALHKYFVYNYVPAPFTVFKRIRKLEPAHYILISEKGVKTEKYWHCDYRKKMKGSIEDYCGMYREILEKSVKRHLVSDVPLGVMLSGGIDSSTILAVMSKFDIPKISTFSIGFQTPGGLDPEFLRARRIAEMFKTKHYETVFKQEDLSLFPGILNFYDEPINIFAIIYIHQIAKFIRENVKVALAGNGGDELFGGYTGYNNILKMARLHNMGRPFSFLTRSHGTKIGRFFSAAFLPPYKRRAEGFRLSAERLAGSLYSGEFREKIKNTDTAGILEELFLESGAPEGPRVTDEEYMDGVFYQDLMFYHTFGHTLIPDISGMANSLETRAPFLDNEFIEFSASLPLSAKIPDVSKPSLNKYVMKKAMEGILPDEILYAPKMGFGFSIDWTDWLRNIWREKVKDILLKRSLGRSGLFNMDYVSRIIEEHARGGKNNANLLWGLITFEIWYEMSVEGKKPGDIII